MRTITNEDYDLIENFTEQCINPERYAANKAEEKIKENISKIEELRNENKELSSIVDAYRFGGAS